MFVWIDPVLGYAKMSVMDASDKILRHLEEVTEEIQALRGKLSQLESHRTEIRKRIKTLMRSATAGETEITEIPHSHRVRHGDALALKQTAEAVARLGGEVDAKQLAVELRISPDAARLRLARTVHQGLIVRTTLGKYAPPPTGNTDNSPHEPHSNGTLRVVKVDGKGMEEETEKQVN